MGNCGGANYYGICSHYYWARETDLRHSESQCGHAQESNPLSAVAAAYITALELVGGILLLIGLGGRWLGLLYIGEFLVVSFYVLVPTRGWMDARLPIMLLAGALMLFVSGSGKASLDHVLGNIRDKASR